MRPTLPQMDDMFFPMPFIYYFTYLRYATEALYLAEIKKYAQVYDITSGMDLLGYKQSDQWWCMLVLPFFGILYRVLAYLCLILLPPGVLVRRWWTRLIDFKSHIAKFKNWARKQREKKHHNLVINAEDDELQEQP